MHDRSSLDPEAIKRALRVATTAATYVETCDATLRAANDACCVMFRGAIAYETKNATEDAIFAATDVTAHGTTYDAVQSCLLKEKS